MMTESEKLQARIEEALGEYLGDQNLGAEWLDLAAQFTNAVREISATAHGYDVMGAMKNLTLALYGIARL